MKIFFRIPFTWYWIGAVAPFNVDTVETKKLCLITKRWDGEKYYWHALI